MPAMVYFGLGFSIKFQVAFLAPFLLLLLLMKRLRWRSLLWVPGVYLLTCIPAWIIGRPIDQLLLLYARQVDSFDQLSLNAPTLYAFWDNSVNYLFNNAGVIAAAGIMLLAVWGVFRLKPNLTPELMLGLAAASQLMIVYLLPKMHERYFFPAEVFLLLAAFYRPRLAWAVVALQVTTLSTYVAYFFGSTFLPLTTASLLNLVVLVWVGYDQARLVMASRAAEAQA
jgi:Gpi18-like mannosyltransferase